MKRITRMTAWVLLIVVLLSGGVTAHPGRTDRNDGHKDNQNKSGLGSYHYHCGGNPAHLHENGHCPYEGLSQETNEDATSVGETSSHTSSQTYYDGLFWDVSATDWFANEVRVSYDLGLVKGDSATSFNPNGNIRLSEAITLASRIHSAYYDNGCVFVQGTPWYQVYVDYAVENGIIQDEQFEDYTAYATRAEFAAIFSAALPDKALPEINVIEAIPDVSGTEPYADDVYKLYRAGILTGNDAYGTFSPDTTIKRCEVAAIVSRMALTEMRKAVS